MASRYAAVHTSPQGPGDARPTAMEILKDEGMEDKLSGKVVLITGCSSGIGTKTFPLAPWKAKFTVSQVSKQLE